MHGWYDIFCMKVVDSLLFPVLKCHESKLLKEGVLPGQFVRCQIYLQNTGIWGYPQGMIKMKIVILSSWNMPDTLKVNFVMLLACI